MLILVVYLKQIYFHVNNMKNDVAFNDNLFNIIIIENKFLIIRIRN